MSFDYIIIQDGIFSQNMDLRVTLGDITTRISSNLFYSTEEILRMKEVLHYSNPLLVFQNISVIVQFETTNYSMNTTQIFIPTMILSDVSCVTDWLMTG